MNAVRIFAVWLGSFLVLFAWLIGGAFYCMSLQPPVGPTEGIGLYFFLPVMIFALGSVFIGGAIIVVLAWRDQ